MKITIQIEIPDKDTSEWEDLKQILALPPATEPSERHRVILRNAILRRLHETFGNININAT